MRTAVLTTYLGLAHGHVQVGEGASPGVLPLPILWHPKFKLSNPRHKRAVVVATPASYRWGDL